MTKEGYREMKINVSNSPWVSEETGISVQLRGKKKCQSHQSGPEKLSVNWKATFQVGHRGSHNI